MSSQVLDFLSKCKEMGHIMLPYTKLVQNYPLDYCDIRSRDNQKVYATT